MSYVPLKTKAAGTVLQATISSTLTTITQRVSIDPANTTIDMKEVTDLDSLLVDKRPTLPDAGELGLQVWLDPHDPTHQYLETSCNTMAGPTVYVLSFPTTPKARLGTFSGYVSSYKAGGVDPKGYLIADVKITLTTLVVWTDAP